jgi:hypothetical protein
VDRLTGACLLAAVALLATPAAAQSVLATPGGAPVVVNFNADATPPAASTDTTLHSIQADGHHNRWSIDTFGAGQTAIHLRKAQGSAEAPSALIANDYISTVKFIGYDGAGFEQAASLACRTGLAWTTDLHEAVCTVEMKSPINDADRWVLFISPEGHWGADLGSDPAPSLGADCGTGAAFIMGTDVFGRVSIGSGPSAQCTLTFTLPFRMSSDADAWVTPVCVANAEDGDYAVRVTNVGSHSIQFKPVSPGVLASGEKIGYQCFQPQND